MLQHKRCSGSVPTETGGVGADSRPRCSTEHWQITSINAICYLEFQFLDIELTNLFFFLVDHVAYGICTVSTRIQPRPQGLDSSEA